MTFLTSQTAVLNTLDSKKPKTIKAIAEQTAIKESTVRFNLGNLESAGLASCINPGKKPLRYTKTQPDYHPTMGIDEAFLLNKLQLIAQSMLPTSLYKEVKHVFSLAKETYERSAANDPLNKVVAFEQNTTGIDMMRHLAAGNVSGSILNAINDAIYHQAPLEVYTTTGHVTLHAVKIEEIDNELYLRGSRFSHRRETLRINTADIHSAECLEDLPSWQMTDHSNTFCSAIN